MGELHLDRDHAVIPAFDDEIDLVLTAMRSEVADPRLGSLRIYTRTSSVTNDSNS